ncbi:cytochrome c oxidase assembly protein [Marivivens donghaensis]|uniref:cytochrome c oxidase assembly protein n=1 Tax=Marivivens donghaensis TaxID=1699413 RepID=UPI00201FA8E3|nr:cytochrome c oxidase assembly protein [Marivivens donghaensis]MCL7409733.1 cytochrome c oxidase assembly protein [Marivivens donghaensis]MDN3705168.1 cytochrome c oxidase assembly protein [Marivivens donghaensis]
MKLFPNIQGAKRTVLQLVTVVVVMGALSWASVPFYSWFCKVTGFGGATNVVETASDVILDREMKIRFDSSTDPSLPWSFKPVQREMTVKIGQTALAYYEATNTSNRPVAGQATYNVVPYEAGGFFDKIECFCFTEQVLQPGETVVMPVSFFVDPAIVDDRDAKYVHTITLSYTFFEIPLPDQDTAALSDTAPADTKLN